MKIKIERIEEKDRKRIINRLKDNIRELDGEIPRHSTTSLCTIYRNRSCLKCPINKIIVNDENLCHSKVWGNKDMCLSVIAALNPNKMEVIGRL